MSELVKHLVVENAVQIEAIEPDGSKYTLGPIDLADSDAGEVFDRLYPPLADEDWQPGEAESRMHVRAAFVQRATELLDSEGKRIGLAAIGEDLYYLGGFNCHGVIAVNGFLADQQFDFIGYAFGLPGRASRDRAELAATAEAIRVWLTSQEQRLRDIGALNDSMQLDLAYVLHRSRGVLALDHAVGMTSEGVLRQGDVARWASLFDEVFLASGVFGFGVSSRPPAFKHFYSGKDIELPESWAILYNRSSNSEFLDKIPVDDIRDQNYRFATEHDSVTWEKRWWWSSGYIEGGVIQAICEGWSCDIRDIMAPVAERGWGDFQFLEEYPMNPVFGYLFRRPGPKSRDSTRKRRSAN